MPDRSAGLEITLAVGYNPGDEAVPLRRRGRRSRAVGRGRFLCLASPPVAGRQAALLERR